MIQLPPDDKVRAIIDVKDLEDKDFVKSHNIVLCTKKGVLKKTELEDFSNPRKTGVNAITIQEGDELLEAKMTDGNCGDHVGSEKRPRHPFPRRKSKSYRPWAPLVVGGIEVEDANDEVIGMICVGKGRQNTHGAGGQ